MRAFRAVPTAPGDAPRRAWRTLAVLLLALSLGACASRPDAGLLTPVSTHVAGAVDHTVLVATTRERDARPGALFSGERSASIGYAAITVSVPPKHVPGKVEMPATPPGNPETDFVTRQADYLDGDKAFVAALDAQLMKQPKGDRQILLFVHGYNTKFAEAVYRLTQVVHDSRSPSVPLLFTWASRGKLADYVYDNNSATAARDSLEHVLRLALASKADHVNILAHSMGNWLTVETLRQIRISGDLRNANKVGVIILAAPDIDLDVFKTQLARFKDLHKVFFIVLSKDDKALGLSSLIAGGRARVGADAQVEDLTALGATVIDLSDVEAIDATGHGKFAQLATVAPELAGVLERGIGTKPAAPRREAAGTAIKDIISLPATLLGAPIAITAGR